MFIGSEGVLGVITEAWMRLQDRPRFRAAASVAFADFGAAAEVVRAISQAGLYPSNCRLLDANEALNAGAGSGAEAVLIVAFESADHPLDAWMQRAMECCRDGGGQVPPGAGQTRTDQDAARDGAAGAWRQSFLGAPISARRAGRQQYVTERSAQGHGATYCWRSRAPRSVGSTRPDAVRPGGRAARPHRAW